MRIVSSKRARRPMEAGLMGRRRGSREAMIRTAIQDRRRLFRDGLCMLLDSEEDVDVVGTAPTPADLLDLCDRERPQVALLQADAAAETVRTVTTLRRRHRRLRLVGIYST